MDKNSITGILLIFALFLVWQQLTAPSAEQIAEEQRIRDSIALAQELDTQNTTAELPATQQEQLVNETDSAKMVRLSSSYGVFAAAAGGNEQETTLENEVFAITFTNKGGRIKEVLLKDYHKAYLDENNEEYTVPLKLLEDEKNRFEYFLPIAGMPSGGVKSSELFFTTNKSDNSVTFRADAGEGRYFEQKYTIQPNSYAIDYSVDVAKLGNLVTGNTKDIQLEWVNYLDKLERNTAYERNYSSVYYKTTDDDPTYCSCTSDDKETLAEDPVKWISHSNQFFNSTIMTAGSERFPKAVVETQMMEENDVDLKKLASTISIPYNGANSQPFAMQMYIGPNEFDRLAKFDNELEYIIPFGSSIFGTINRWVIRPLFNFLSGFIGSAGFVILALTVIVKLVLYPLTYKMLYSQSKMAALKPRIAAMGDKFKDDPQKKQMETMKLYQQYGVNPLGGCLPMVLQMPIWFALYRFFPASIEFRQASFLWATDLSSYDAFAYLPFEIPFYGAHVSLFTILWAVTTVIYTFYNSKHMDMSAQPAMKYMQYAMPIMFLFFFNNFAAGLTCYLFFSNLFNIAQTLITKEVIIDKDKIKKELEIAKAKPKKKGGFREKLEKAMAEQQKIAAERAKKK